MVGIPGNTITYNTLLDACAKSGAMSRVEEIFEKMRHGTAGTPSTVVPLCLVVLKEKPTGKHIIIIIIIIIIIL